MALGKAVHLHEPMGGSGRGPFAPVLKERDRVVQNVRALVMEELGDRVPRPTFGSVVPRLLGDQGDEAAAHVIRVTLRAQILRHEPQIDMPEFSPQVTISSDDASTATRVVISISGVLKRTGEAVDVRVGIDFPLGVEP